MALGWLCGFCRDSRRVGKQRRIHGYKLDMYMSTPREGIDRQYVEDAVYIPTNDRNLVSHVITRRLELDITAGNTVVLCWQTESLGFGSDIYKMEFGVRSDLPCSVILGKLDPSVFHEAPGELFDESFEFPKSRPNSVSNAMSRAVKSPASGSGPTTAKNKNAKMEPPAKPTNLANRTNTTSTWASDQTRVVRTSRNSTWESDDTKVNAQQSSPQRLSPIASSPSSSPLWTLMPSKVTHSAITVPAVKRDLEAQNDDNRQNNRNRQSVVESTARLGPAPCEVAEDAREGIRRPQFGESSTEHSNLQREKEPASVERFLQPGPNSAQDHKTAELVKTSDSSMDERESQSKKRSHKRGKVPRIRRAKLDASHNVDLTPAPGAEEYWTYDPGARAYYHTDSDTHSRIWKSESDSEDSEDSGA